jgi:hypothetical protein
LEPERRARVCGVAHEAAWVKFESVCRRLRTRRARAAANPVIAGGGKKLFSNVVEMPRAASGHQDVPLRHRRHQQVPVDDIDEVCGMRIVERDT